MSVYSGFATRQQESFYNKVVLKLLQIMQDKMIRNYNGGTSSPLYSCPFRDD